MRLKTGQRRDGMHKLTIIGTATGLKLLPFNLVLWVSGAFPFSLVTSHITRTQ